MGRLTKDVEVKYTQSATPTAVARYSIALPRQYTKSGEKEVDFFNVVAFGKGAEFVSKYFEKGMMIAISGRLQVSTWEDKNKVKHTSVDVIAENQYFTGDKKKSGEENTSAPTTMGEDDDLPF